MRSKRERVSLRIASNRHPFPLVAGGGECFDQIMNTSSPRLVLTVSSRDHIRGPSQAPVTLVEYGDYECPHCAAAHLVVEAVRWQMASRLRFVFRHFPLSQIHPHAQHAAEAAEAAGAQRRFWAMHDRLFTHQDALDNDSLLAHAALIRLDVAQFARELATGIHALRVREDFATGVRSGVNGTPTLFMNGVRYDGPRDYDSLIAAIAHVQREGEGARTTV